MDNKQLLIELFHQAVRAADAKLALIPHLPKPPKGKTVVIGAGKGAAQLAQAFEDLWPVPYEGPAPYEGVVVTRYGFGAPCKNIKVLEASHPVPDENSIIGAKALMDAVSGLNEDDLVIALICGGGSALLVSPDEGLGLLDKIALNEALLASGAPISAMNSIRKACSKVKGGRLAKAAYPAKVVSLIVSDVPGDVASEVASGPTVPSATGVEDALNAIQNFQIQLSDRLINHIKAAKNIPSAEAKEFTNNEVAIIASSACSLEAAEKYANENGFEVAILSDAIEGEAREIAKMHAAMVKEIIARNRPFKKPIILLSGGETTVTLKGTGGKGGKSGTGGTGGKSGTRGKGGNNSEFMLSLAIELDGIDGFLALGADTDGIDGSEENAGAFVDGMSASKMRAKGINPMEMLQNNDSWTAFHAIDGLFSPGPTGTNVNDFRALIIR